MQTTRPRIAEEFYRGSRPTAKNNPIKNTKKI